MLLFAQVVEGDSRRWVGCDDNGIPNCAIANGGEWLDAAGSAPALQAMPRGALLRRCVPLVGERDAGQSAC